MRDRWRTHSGALQTLWQREARQGHMATRWTNKIKIGSRRVQPTVRKVSADSVPYGPNISTQGNYVWCAYEGDEVVAIAPTAAEARGKHREAMRQRLRVAEAAARGEG